MSNEMARWVAERLDEDRERHIREWYAEAMRDHGCDCEETTKPYDWTAEGDSWISAHYHCQNCGKRWDCGWSLPFIEGAE